MADRYGASTVRRRRTNEELARVDEAITSHIDADRWVRLREVEKAERESFLALRDSWGALT
jgi:hypothetical protein